MADSTKYASMAKRIQAASIDLIIVAILFIGLSVFMTFFPDSPIPIRVVVIFLPFLGYEPICTSYSGGTIGYYLMNQRVCDAKSRHNL